MSKSTWTAEEDALLCKMAEAHATAAEIAAALPGKSRLAVIGRAYRLGVRFVHGKQMSNVRTAAKAAERRRITETSVLKKEVSEPYRPGIDPRPSWLNAHRAGAPR